MLPFASFLVTFMFEFQSISAQKFECIGEDACKSTTIQCEPSLPCSIICNGKASCLDMKIIPNGATNMNLYCAGEDACKGEVVLNCGRGACSLDCNYRHADKICHGITVNLNDAKSFECLNQCPTNIAKLIFSPIITSTKRPTKVPTKRAPTIKPTSNPSKIPTNSPTLIPTNILSANPTSSPTYFPTNTPSHSPSKIPTNTPTNMPTFQPSQHPTSNPSHNPTHFPSDHPSMSPSKYPSSLTAAPSYYLHPETLSPSEYILPSVTITKTTTTIITTTSMRPTQSKNANGGNNQNERNQNLSIMSALNTIDIFWYIFGLCMLMICCCICIFIAFCLNVCEKDQFENKCARSVSPCDLDDDDDNNLDYGECDELQEGKSRANNVLITHSPNIEFKEKFVRQRSIHIPSIPILKKPFKQHGKTQFNDDACSGIGHDIDIEEESLNLMETDDEEKDLQQTTHLHTGPQRMLTLTHRSKNFEYVSAIPKYVASHSIMLSVDGDEDETNGSDEDCDDMSGVGQSITMWSESVVDVPCDISTIHGTLIGDRYDDDIDDLSVESDEKVVENDDRYNGMVDKKEKFQRLSSKEISVPLETEKILAMNKQSNAYNRYIDYTKF